MTELPGTRTELDRLMDEHDLVASQVVRIIGCSRRTVEHYRAGVRAMPPYRLRLLLLELGAERPAWTPAKRRAALRKQYLG